MGEEDNLNPTQKPPKIDEFQDKSQELEGSLGYGSELMKSVLEADQETIEQGQILQDAIDRGLGSFTSDMLMASLVNNYKLTKKLYGERLLRKLTGYDTDYLEKNIQTPEFRNEVLEKVEDTFKDMKKKKLLDKEGKVTERGIELVALSVYVQDLDNLTPRGVYGEKFHKKRDIHGMREDVKIYSRGDRYRDLAIRRSISSAIRRERRTLQIEDLKVHERQSKGEIELVYCLDASSSMKGERLSAAKRAGVALAHRALEEKDKVGLLIFGDEIFSRVYPSNEFGILLKEITQIKPKGQTNFANVILESIDLFSSDNNTKHLILLSDALPTSGKDPARETLNAVSMAAAAGITVSLIGLGIDKSGEKLGQKIVEIGNGRFYIVRDTSELDRIILTDYYAL